MDQSHSADVQNYTHTNMITNKTRTGIFTLFVNARQLEQALKQQFIKLIYLQST